VQANVSADKPAPPAFRWNRVWRSLARMRPM